MSASLEQQLIALYPVLADMAPQARQSLFACAQIMKVPASSRLFDERQPCQGFPLIAAGSVRVSKLAPNGRELPLYRVTPGETCIITSSCLLGGSAYNARGLAESDLVLAFIPSPDFMALLADPAFREFVFHLFAARIADLMQVVEEVAFQKLDQRLAALLLGKGRILHTTHQALADELGSVREIVSRLLKNFAAENLVALSREQIEILDPVGLRRLAAGGRS